MAKIDRNWGLELKPDALSVCTWAALLGPRPGREGMKEYTRIRRT